MTQRPVLCVLPDLVLWFEDLRLTTVSDVCRVHVVLQGGHGRVVLGHVVSVLAVLRHRHFYLKPGPAKSLTDFYCLHTTPSLLSVNSVQCLVWY